MEFIKKVEFMVKISIIMPIYNGAQFLNKTINSINNQTLKDVEIICVDDGSTDDSLNVLEELKNKYNSIKIIEQKNQGSGKARNNGIKNARGEFIAFLDADDVFLDNHALEVMYNFSIDNNADITSANLQFIEKDYNLKENWHYINGDYMYFSSYDFISPKEYGIPYAFYKNIFKRDFIIKHNILFPDLIRGQDPIFLAKALASTNKIYTVPLNFYGYNYSIGGGVNVKINDYNKKYSYMQHFKDTCDTLNIGGLVDCANIYKIHLFNYLTWRENIFDEELYLIYDELFKGLDDYFDKTNEQYIKFNILSAFHSLLYETDNESFNNIKNEFSKISYAHDDIVSEKLHLVINSSSLDDVKLNYKNNPIKQWRKINKEFYNLEIGFFQRIVDNNNKLIMQNKELLRENKYLINENNNIDDIEKINANRHLINENRRLIKENRQLINKNRQNIKN